MKDAIAVIIVLLLMGLLLFVGSVIGDYMGFDSGANYMRAEAVKAGHAEYYLDAENNRQWRWREAK